jgi:hypothetical protein
MMVEEARSASHAWFCGDPNGLTNGGAFGGKSGEGEATGGIAAGGFSAEANGDGVLAALGTKRGASESAVVAVPKLMPKYRSRGWRSELGIEVPNIAARGTTTRQTSMTSARNATVAEDCVFNGDSFRRGTSNDPRI